MTMDGPRSSLSKKKWNFHMRLANLLDEEINKAKVRLAELLKLQADTPPTT